MVSEELPPEIDQNVERREELTNTVEDWDELVDRSSSHEELLGHLGAGEEGPRDIKEIEKTLSDAWKELSDDADLAGKIEAIDKMLGTNVTSDPENLHDEVDDLLDEPDEEDE